MKGVYRGKYMFAVRPPTIFAEINQEEIFCIVRRVNETNCANDPFNIRKMSSETTSDPITTIFTDIVNSSSSLQALFKVQFEKCLK